MITLAVKVDYDGLVVESSCDADFDGQVLRALSATAIDTFELALNTCEGADMQVSE